MPFGMGPRGWFAYPYAPSYWYSGRCRWYPWLPRWWWTGVYGRMTPYMAPYGMLPLSKEEEISMLEEQAKLLEEEANVIKKRLEELRR